MPDEPFVECFEKWKLVPSYERVTVVLNWKHMYGWVSFSLLGKDFERVWKFQDGWQKAIKND